MDRRVADDDITLRSHSQSHKSIAQVNRTSQSHKRIAQTNHTKQDDVTSKNGNDKTMLGMLQSNSGAYGVPETVNLTEICPSRRVGHFKAPC